MATFFTCAKGHRWEAPLAGANGANGNDNPCPRCGEPSEQAAWANPANDETIAPRSPPSAEPPNEALTLAPRSEDGTDEQPGATTVAGYEIVPSSERGARVNASFGGSSEGGERGAIVSSFAGL